MEVVRGIKSPVCHTRVRGLGSLRLNWIYVFRKKKKASRNQNYHCDKMGWRWATAAVSRKAFSASPYDIPICLQNADF
jgi:hypothetical protein